MKTALRLLGCISFRSAVVGAVAFAVVCGLCVGPVVMVGYAAADAVRNRVSGEGMSYGIMLYGAVEGFGLGFSVGMLLAVALRAGQLFWRR